MPHGMIADGWDMLPFARRNLFFRGELLQDACSLVNKKVCIDIVDFHCTRFMQLNEFCKSFLALFGSEESFLLRAIRSGRPEAVTEALESMDEERAARELEIPRIVAQAAKGGNCQLFALVLDAMMGSLAMDQVRGPFCTYLQAKALHPRNCLYGHRTYLATRRKPATSQVTRVVLNQLSVSTATFMLRMNPGAWSFSWCVQCCSLGSPHLS